MRKTIGTLVGLVAISLCVIVSFYSVAQGEKQRKDMDRITNDIVIAKARNSDDNRDRVSDSYSRGAARTETGS